MSAMPEGAMKCFHVTEEERVKAVKSSRPFHEFARTDTYFLITKYQSIEVLEGYIGHFNLSAIYFWQIDRTYSYFIDYLKCEKVYFTFDNRALFELVNIFTSSPLKLVLRMVSNFTNMEKENDKPGTQIHITAGHGNTITTGSNNTVTNNTQLYFNDLGHFKHELASNKIESDDIEDIAEIVQLEKPNEKGDFGIRTKNWISKMLTKSVNGTWEVGVATAGGLLTELLKAYFGIK